MGTYQKGILGSFQGQVGTVVGSSWRGKEVMKSRPKTSTTPPTQKQIVQQARFSFVAKFISSLAKLFRVSFNDRSSLLSGMNNAFQYNYLNALRGSYPTFSFDFSKVLISKGDLDPAKTPAVALNGQLLTFSWVDNSGVAQANATDKCIMVVYCPEASRSTYKIGNATRTTGTDTIDVERFSGMTVETWLAFISEDEKEVSISKYTGEVVIA